MRYRVEFRTASWDWDTLQDYGLETLAEARQLVRAYLFNPAYQFRILEEHFTEIERTEDPHDDKANP